MHEIIRKTWLVLILAALLNLMFFVFRLLNYPDFIQVQYTPDDGYYYLTLARNFIYYGNWTFDSQSVTSGFHLLFAYLLALIFKIIGPNDALFVKAAIFFSFITTLAALIPLAGFLKAKIWAKVASACLIISSLNFVWNSSSVMEWPLVLIFSGYYCFLFFKVDFNRKQCLYSTTLFLLGFGGSLARSDFGLLPFSLFLAGILSVVLRNKEGIRLITPLFSGLMGSVAGVITVFIHNYFYTGQFMQSSALVKEFWSQTMGHSVMPFFTIILSLFVPNPYILFNNPKLLLTVVVLLLLILLLFLNDKKITLNSFKKIPGKELILFLGSVITIAGYSVFYRLNSEAIQPWYTANVVIPVYIVISAVLTKAGKYLNTKYLLVINVYLIFFVLINLVSINIVGSPWPHQTAMLKAGKTLGTLVLDGKVAAWNAGIIGFYQGGTVVNIDGLVNNEVYPYIKNNSLHKYLIKKQITYIADFNPMFESKKLRIRGGYNNNYLENAIESSVFNFRGNGYWDRLNLYRLNLKKLPS